MKTDLLGISIDSLTMEETIDRIQKAIEENARIRQVSINAGKLVLMVKNKELYNSVISSDIISADGQSIVWASRFLGKHLPSRVAGCDLMQELVKLAYENKYKCYFFGAREGVIRKVVDQYNAYEPLPGFHVNGQLPLGENIADLGGDSIAYEALERALAKAPAKRKQIDGFSPEQRFFLSMSQVWRSNCKEAEARRLLTVDPHSPGQYRAIGAHVNLPEFYEAFGIKAGAPMWRAPDSRAKIW